VEVAVLVPVLMVLVLAVIQFALWAHAASVVQSAAAEGSQVARDVGGSAGAGEIRAQAAVSRLGSAVVQSPQVHAFRDTDSAGVSVRAVAEPILPFLRFTVSATSSGPTQRFRSYG
jgi:Flp pilus assembly protein TadG